LSCALVRSFSTLLSSFPVPLLVQNSPRLGQFLTQPLVIALPLLLLLVLRLLLGEACFTDSLQPACLF
jgi:hypothetical protein